MANWIRIKLRNGSEYVIRSEVTKATENPLTNNERIIADLWQQINNLTIPIVVVSLKCDCKHSGGCRYEEVVLETKEVCRHKE